MVGRELLILKTSPSVGSESCVKEFTPSCTEPLGDRGFKTHHLKLKVTVYLFHSFSSFWKV